MTRTHSQSGQIGIIIILLMVVMLTIGLSLASQATRDVSLSQQNEVSNRIFNAAEVGVEQALSSDLNAQTQDLVTQTASVAAANANVNYSIQRVKTLNTRLLQGTTARVQLTDSSGAQTTTGITIEWGKETACSQKPATLLVSVFSFDSTTYPKTSVRYYAYAPCDYGDGITVVNTAGSTYFRQTTITLQPKDVLVRIKPMYNDTAVIVSGVGGTLPVQGYTITSTATNQLGNETRSVQVNRTLSTAPSVMDYVLFSGTTLTK